MDTERVLSEHDQFLEELDSVVDKIFSSEKKLTMEEYTRAYT